MGVQWLGALRRLRGASETAQHHLDGALRKPRAASLVRRLASPWFFVGVTPLVGVGLMAVVTTQGCYGRLSTKPEGCTDTLSDPSNCGACGHRCPGSCTGGVCQTYVKSISAGDWHTCALLIDSTIRCWGSNGRGQLGVAPTEPDAADWSASPDPHPHPIPMDPSIAVTANEVSGGGGHTCALTAGPPDGSNVMCWGEDEFGQLGDDPAQAPYSHWQPLPVRLKGTTVLSLTSGAHHSCVTEVGEVAECWGRNDYGQLGTGPSHLALPDGYDGPGYVVDGNGSDKLGSVSEVFAGDWHSCAQLLDEAGTVACWGRNDACQLGDPDTGMTCPPGSDVPCSTVPVPVSLQGPVLSISSRGSYTCAIVGGEHGVICWGDNEYRQLGGASSSDSSCTAVQVLETGSMRLTQVREIAVGVTHACAIVDTDVYCWGSESHGQLGNGVVMAGGSARATHVDGLGGGAKQIVAGYRHTCALLTDGTVACWGSNEYGQVGTEPISNSVTTPTQVVW